VTNRTPSNAPFPRCCRRRVEASFDGGHITSDGGVLLLRQAARQTGLLRRVAHLIDDPRRQASCDHRFEDILEQRVFGVALGYEDLNDHDALRDDLALQTAVGRDERLAHPTTIGRLEGRAQRDWAWAAHQALFEQFVAAYDEPPDEVVLDFDTTDDQVHGGQVGRFFHGYYDGYCFLPLYVFCGDHLLVALLQEAGGDGAKHAPGVLALLVRQLRAVWPETRIVLRGDGGFCRWRMLRWCENNGVGYVVGVSKNKRLIRQIQPDLDEVERLFEEHQTPQRKFVDLRYAAGSWDRERRVIAKAEHLPGRSNPRFIVTNLDGDPRHLYEDVFCARGEMENRIKEQQLDLFADRTSCHNWWPNQWRLLLASLAYTLMAHIRRVGLQGTAMARATCGSIRLKLLKIGAVVLRNTRRVRLLLSSAYPSQAFFWEVARRLSG
jgi:hypothetical protein